jgi:hypothetical protein
VKTIDYIKILCIFDGYVQIWKENKHQVEREKDAEDGM